MAAKGKSGFSPLAWFAALTPEDKLTLFRQVLSEFERMDPGAVARMGVWTRGKSSRFACDLPLPGGGTARGVGIHLSVEGGDRDLWRNLSGRAGRGDLNFGPGWLEASRDGRRPEQQAWLAPLGVGTLAAVEQGGDLMFVATKRQMVPIPEGMRTGAPIPVGLPPGEGFVVLLFEGQPMIVGSFSGLRPDEIRAARTAPVRVGLVPVTEGLMFLALDVPGLTEGWADLPFSLAIEPIERRRISPPDKEGSRPLLLVLVDRATGIVAAMRPLLMPSDWSAEFERILESHEDVSGRYGKQDYMRDIAAAHRRWPNPNDLSKHFTAVGVARDNPGG